MKPLLIALVCLTVSAVAAADSATDQVLFDGKTFRGWEGDTNATWRVQDGALVGGSLTRKVPRNEFLVYTRPFTNFVLRLKFKLTGTEGFINAGVQVRSQRVKDSAEMCGYQADMGDGWWGALYDESRRNKPLAQPDPAVVEKAVKKGDWNDYEIVCDGRRIRTRINGLNMVDYTEPDLTLPQWGFIGLQIHGDGKAEAAYKDIRITVLP